MATLTYSSFPILSSRLLKNPSQQSSDVVTIILGGGEGTRLYPLTLTRCKPATPFAGKYRLIDVPLSNSIHSQCYKIFVLTQFLSTSLHQHLIRTYQFNNFTPGFIEILAAEQKPLKTSWYQGTADAVRQNLSYFMETSAEYFLILSGDQLYKMDYRKMIDFMKKHSSADVVVASLPVNESLASRMGILKINEEQMIMDFVEKPQQKEVLEKYKVPSSYKTNYIGSMGIYLFKRKALYELLVNDNREDFGKHLIPSLVKKGKAAAYLYDGYWEDIGTIESYHKANIALTKPNSLLEFYEDNFPLYSAAVALPPPKILGTQAKHSLICEGALIEADAINDSVIGQRSVIKKGSIIDSSIIMGNSFYRLNDPDTGELREPSIGEDCIIRKTIIDTNATIGDRVQLINKENYLHYDGAVFVRDGIIIVPQGTSVPDGFIF